MEIALFIIIIILLLYNNSRHKDELNIVKNLLARNLDEILFIKNKIENLENNSIISEKNSENLKADLEVPEEAIEKSFFDSLDVDSIIEEADITENVPEEQIPPIPNNTIPPIPSHIEPEEVEAIFAAEPTIPKLSWIERFKQNNPDIEKFIGENLINKIGIIILVLGISFFVKYAIDKDWINEPGRVGIGILAGGILLGFAHKLRTQFKAFSSVLVAGAVSVFYFTIGIAFHDYQLFSQSTAFAIMIAITIFSVFVSLAYNRQELGVLSTIAGFAVPFMVSTGVGNYHVLLTYLCILNIGMLIISYYKRWFIVNFTALICTFLVVGGWYSTLYEPEALTLQHTFIYCTAFYVIFMIAFVVNNIVHKNKFAMYEMGALITSTALYFAIGSHIINQIAPAYLGIFTILLGIGNIIFAYIIYKKHKFDQNIIYVLIGLALTLATLTIPIQFSGNFITIFWACEAVLLFWLAQKSNMKGFLVSGILVQLLALISLLLDMKYYTYDLVPYVFAFNLQFITSLMVIGSGMFTYQLFHTHPYDFKFTGLKFDSTYYRKVIFNVTLVLAYILPLIEIYYQADAKLFNEGTIFFYLYLYHMLFSTVLVYLLEKKENIGLRWKNTIILFNAILYLIVAYRLPIIEKQETFYGVFEFPFAFNLHYITLALLLFQIWIYTKRTIMNSTKALTLKSFEPWFLVIFITYLLSSELNIVFLFQTHSYSHFYETRDFVLKVIFPVLWGLISFAILIFGIKKDMKVFRVIALILLGVTILKLFIYDIKDASETGKIIAFILLGALILVISFVYQKIKKLVVNNDETSK